MRLHSKLKLSAPEIFVIVTLLISGLVACFMLPIGGGFDEETHLARVWEMSSFVFLPNRGLGKDMPFPTIFRELSYRRDVLVRAIEPDFLSEYANTPIDGLDYTYGRIETRSVYSPPLLLPQALIMRYVGRSFMERGWHMPALVVLYLMRLAGLFSYTLLVWLGVRYIPYGKWILAIVAVSPSALLQAVTIGADAISNGIAFLFIGGALALTGRDELGWKEWGAFILLYVTLFFAKVNVVPFALLPFLLLSPSQFKDRKLYWFLIPAVLVLFVLESVWWSVIALPAYVAAPEGANAVEQVKFILSDPFSYVRLLWYDFYAVHGQEYFMQWAALYGFGYWPVPALTYILYIPSTIAVLFVRDDQQRIRWKHRAAFFLVFLMAYVLTITSLYLSYNPVGSQWVAGVQGRYFIALMPMLYLCFANLPLPENWQLSARPVMALAGTAILFYVAGMILSYHVLCGSTYYRLGLCYQPVYKNWAPDERFSEPVSNALTLEQEIVPECNGMTELRVWADASSADPSSLTQFTVRDPGDDQVLSNVSVSPDELPDGDWYTLTFDPEWDSSGRLYLLTIESDSTEDVAGTKISYSLEPEYTAGKLLENQITVQQDVIFQYGCIAGLEKMLRDESP